MSDLRERVEAAVRGEIQPALAMDGVGVEVSGVEGGTVRLRLTGACPACPSSVRAVLVGVEEALRRVGGVQRVVVAP